MTPAQRLELVRNAFSLGDTDRARRGLEPLLSDSRVPADAWALACRIEMADRAFGAAAQYIARAVSQEPENHSYLYNYATCLALDGDKLQAIEVYQRALQIKPDLWVVYHNLGHVLRDLGRSREAIVSYQRAFNSGALDIATMSQILLSMHLFCVEDHDRLFEMHCRLGREIAARNPRVRTRGRRVTDRNRIRLGYVSPRFSREIVGYFFKPLFDHHDRDRFELYLYCATPRRDELTAYFSHRADKWTEVGGLTDAGLCERIIDDDIDILIDLAGHAPENRMAAIARKPAPVQISMLDYFDTTGVGAMDYYVTDRYSTPDGAPQKFTEQLIYLNQPRLVYEAPGYAPPVAVRDSRQGGLVFGSFNRHQKIVPLVVETWSRLLQTVPDARLLLKGGAFESRDVQQSLLERFAESGIAPQRIEFRGASPHPQMLSEYGDIDIALDTFPYNGGLTTCEALWMGTPVITLLGNRIISRQTAGMLEAVGVPEFIANNVEEFAGIGRYWSTRRDELNELRYSLRPRMAASPLTDAASYAADLENHLQRIWHEHLKTGSSGACGNRAR